MVDKAQILNELKRYKNFTTNAEFARFLQITPQNLANWYRRNTFDVNLLANLFTNVNKSWLLTGEGEMLVDGNEEAAVSQSGVGGAYMVPLLSLDVVGGSKNEISDAKEYVIGYMPFVEGREGDYAIAVSGTSMYPTIPPGSVVLMRSINWRDYIEYGQVYVIDLQDDRRIIKEVRRCYDDPRNIIIYSHNPDAGGEQVISLSLVRNMFLVKAQYQRTSM